jgi:hypothetical protein
MSGNHPFILVHQSTRDLAAMDLQGLENQAFPITTGIEKM